MKNLLCISISVSALALMASGCTDSPPAQASSEFDISDQPTVIQDPNPVAASRGGGGGRRGGPLVMRADVQAELGLSEEQVTEIAGLLEDSEGQEPGDGGSALDEVLSDEQSSRLRELSLQRAGLRALAQSEVAEKLGLSADQSAKIEAAIEAGRPQRGAGGFDREAFMKLREEMTEKIMDVLTNAQEAKWEAMLGEPFEFQRQQRRDGAGTGASLTQL